MMTKKEENIILYKVWSWNEKK